LDCHERVDAEIYVLCTAEALEEHQEKVAIPAVHISELVDQKMSFRVLDYNSSVTNLRQDKS